MNYRSCIYRPRCFPWGEKCNPCLCYEGRTGGSRSRAPIERLQNFTTSQCLLENLSKSYLHCLSQARGACKLYRIYSLSWPLIHRNARKVCQTRKTYYRPATSGRPLYYFDMKIF
ncbi:hypothetical protein PUN28_010159 [Cardiocondyla obscurior]|uniref:Uncharacterized protein n=1 Tax=Cardiocondyla obscurior TaxID=286306 RepID=A0AAW2FSM0_9HYME